MPENDRGDRVGTSVGMVPIKVCISLRMGDQRVRTSTP
jgi:hypothetical protein